MDGLQQKNNKYIYVYVYIQVLQWKGNEAQKATGRGMLLTAKNNALYSYMLTIILNKKQHGKTTMLSVLHYIA